MMMSPLIVWHFPVTTLQQIFWRGRRRSIGEPHLIKALCHDALYFFHFGQFQPDGLANTAILSQSKQGFTSNDERQTFQDSVDWFSEVGNAVAQMVFVE